MGLEAGKGEAAGSTFMWFRLYFNPSEDIALNFGLSDAPVLSKQAHPAPVEISHF